MNEGPEARAPPPHRPAAHRAAAGRRAAVVGRRGRRGVHGPRAVGSDLGRGQRAQPAHVRGVQRRRLRGQGGGRGASRCDVVKVVATARP